MFRLRCVFVCTFVVLALASCGGGGGGGGGGVPPGDESLLSGDYFMWLLYSQDDTPDEGGSLWGEVSADGMGGLTGTTTENGAGSVTGGIALPATAYTVAPSRATALTFGTFGFTGWTNAAGTLLATGSTTAAFDPSIIALLKLGSGFNLGSLSGDYHVTGYIVNGTGEAITYWGNAAFNGAGTVTITAATNTEGTVVPPIAVTATYSITASGRLTIVFPGGGDTFTGSILPDGELALVAGSTVNGGDPGAFAFIPKATTAANSTLSGSYQLIGLERDGSSFTSLTGEANASGINAITATFTRNQGGVISTSGPDVVDYSVTGDGTLTVDATADMMMGGVSPSGAYAILSGPSAPGSSPDFLVLMRR
jgi:hypothetical protein